MDDRRRPGAGGSWSFEDAIVGSTILHPRRRTVGADEHVWLAWITNNASDLHGDAAAAAGRSGFGRTIVLGALTVAVVIGLAEPAEWPAPLAARHQAKGWRSIRLVGAVFSGDTLRAESLILAATPLAGGEGGIVQRLVVGRTQAGREVARIEEERAVAARSLT